MVTGLALFCGIIGAVFAGTPLRIFVDQFGWRNVMLFSAAITVLTGAGTWLFVRDYPEEKGYRDFIPLPSHPAAKKDLGIIADVLHVFTYRNIVLLFVIPGGIVGCVLTFSGLWGVPYLTTLHGVSPTTAATLTSALLVAWAVGGPFFGWLSDRLRNRKKLYLIGCAISVSGWTALILMRDISLGMLIPLLLITGFSSGCMIISFAFAKESVPTHLAGTVSGVNYRILLPAFLYPGHRLSPEGDMKGQTVFKARSGESRSVCVQHHPSRRR